jgi:hypothetical protein
MAGKKERMKKSRETIKQNRNKNRKRKVKEKQM